MGFRDNLDSAAADREARRPSFLHRLGPAHSTDVSRFEVITRTVALALNAAAACVSIGESTERWILSSYLQSGKSIAIESALSGCLAAGSELVVVENCRVDGRFAASVGFFAACPIVDQNAGVTCALWILDDTPRDFDERSREVLRGFAVWVDSELTRLEREHLHLESANVRLVAPAVHRMRGALTSIHGFSGFLLSQDCAAPQRQEVLEIIHYQAAYLASLINELVDLLHLEISAGRDLKFALKPIEDILREAVAAWDGGSVNLRIQGGLQPISVDAEQLQRALLRLLGYASGAGNGECVDVSVRPADEPGYMAISVKHRYPEASHPEVHRAFEPFSPPDRSDVQRPSNSGLAFTKQIIELHGGKSVISDDRAQHCVEVSLLLPIPPNSVK